MNLLFYFIVFIASVLSQIEHVYSIHENKKTNMDRIIKECNCNSTKSISNSTKKNKQTHNSTKSKK